LTAIRSGRNASADLPTRQVLLERLRGGQSTRWDVIVVGGGATGLGTAVDAASRGFRTLLLEAHDFASGTSSKATKLLHGGVRYLAQGNLALVREALRERDILLRNAPGLTAPLDFVIPTYSRTARYYYGAGMKVYDVLAGRLTLARSKLLDATETLAALPTLQPDGLRGGVLYADGQFDDARLALALARTASREGALVANYVSVHALVKDADGRVTGVSAREQETGEAFHFESGCVVNATGVWADGLRRCDRPDQPPMISPSQGTHLVLDRSFLPGHTAMLVPKTSDGRLLFMVPWLGHTLVGTTDTPMPDLPLGSPAPDRHSAAHTPVPLPEEVSFILDAARPYLTRAPRLQDVRSAWAGLRPLVASPDGARHTAKVSREHTVLVAPSRLVTVTGGKWTTYRRMAETVLDTAAEHGLLPARAGITSDLALHCADSRAVSEKEPEPDDDAVRAAVRCEGALTVEDVLARRCRQLFLDARRAVALAPRVAELVARERGRDGQWARRQVDAMEAEAAKFVV
jgi:glycerol-3-phosphate dehydrogenase